MIRVTARNGVVFEITEMAGKGDMLGTGDVLVAKEQDLVLEQQAFDFIGQAQVTGGISEADARDFSAGRV